MRKTTPDCKLKFLGANRELWKIRKFILGEFESRAEAASSTELRMPWYGGGVCIGKTKGEGGGVAAAR